MRQLGPCKKKNLSKTSFAATTYDTDYDFFATFHNAPKGDMDRGTCNAVFVDGHTEQLDLMDETFVEAREKAWEVAYPAWPAVQQSPTGIPP